MPLKEKRNFPAVMIPQQTIDAVKRVPITSYLQAKGILPAHKIESGKNQYAYRSPLSMERTPSFFVNEHDNVFNDYSTGEKGDVIRLVRTLERITFFDAVKKLETFVGSAEPLQFSTYELASERAGVSDCTITAVRTLQHPSLIQYVENERCIPYAYARPHVRQIHYSRRDKDEASKRFFGVGFRTNCGSWAVRTSGFKTWIGNSDITTIPVAGSETVNLFEGFFNYLSALVYFGRYTSSNTCIVLNSVSNLKTALPTLQEAKHVNCYLDNDRAGRKAVADLISANVRVADRSGLYSSYNDFNDFLRNR